MKPNPRAIDKELAQLTKRLNRFDEERELACGLGRHFAKILQQKWPNNTSAWASAFSAALIHVESDIGGRHGCRNLLIQWMMERFAGFFVEELLPDIHDVYAKLHSLQYTGRDKLVFNDLDDAAWHIPAKDKLVFVMQSQSRRKLVILHSSNISTSVDVRRVWYRYDEGRNNTWKRLRTLPWYQKREWKPEYSDCRDSGYILSYNTFLKHDSKCDRADLYFGELETFREASDGRYRRSMKFRQND